MGAGVLPRFENNWTRIFEIHFYYYCCCFLSKERPTCHACFQRKERGFLLNKGVEWQLLPSSPSLHLVSGMESATVFSICHMSKHTHDSYVWSGNTNLFCITFSLEFPLHRLVEYLHYQKTNDTTSRRLRRRRGRQPASQPMFTTSPYRKRHQHCCSCYIYMSIYSIGVHFLGIIT